MSDLLIAEISLQVYRNLSSPPVVPLTPGVNEVSTVQVKLQNFTSDTFSMSPNSNIIVSLPHQPYDMFFIETTSPLSVNINGNGFRVVNPGGLVTFAPVTSCVVLNDQIPAGGSTPLNNVEVRYHAGKFAS